MKIGDKMPNKKYQIGTNKEFTVNDLKGKNTQKCYVSIDRHGNIMCCLINLHKIRKEDVFELCKNKLNI